MNLPQLLTTAIQDALDTQILKISAVSGGDISQAARATLAEGREVLIKWNASALPGLFTAEWRGLALLQSSNTLRVPEVLAHREPVDNCPGFIVMEWLERGASSYEVAAVLGRGLATMHRVTADSFGLDHDNYIGANSQPNQPAADWVTFYREQRLGFQLELARRNGYLHRERAGRLEKVMTRLGDWLPVQPGASLLHGDLWGGNWLVTASGEPALIDPAVYYGHREADLAFTELFGGFPAAFYRAYEQAWPLEAGYEARKDLYNLYHLLNHLNLFGEGYGGQVDAILRRYAG
jgi:fructosamine-3-kinase